MVHLAHCLMMQRNIRPQDCHHEHRDNSNTMQHRFSPLLTYWDPAGIARLPWSLRSAISRRTWRCQKLRFLQRVVMDSEFIANFNPTTVSAIHCLALRNTHPDRKPRTFTHSFEIIHDFCLTPSSAHPVEPRSL